MFDGYGQFLIENQNYYKKIIAPSEWVKNKFISKFNLPENKISVWPVGIEEFNNIREINMIASYILREETRVNWMLLKVSCK